MAASLSQLVEHAIIGDMQKAIEGEARRATYTVGGSIPIKVGSDRDEDVDEGTRKDVLRPSHTIQIRFDEAGQGVTLTLPIARPRSSTSCQSASKAPDSIPLELGRLLSAAAAASLEESKQSRPDQGPGKLGKTAFLTSFCPYTAGIVDVVQQIMLPDHLIKQGNHGIRAELCELVIHDAPRESTEFCVINNPDEDLIGRLVVALPVDHEGARRPPLERSSH